MNIHEIKERIAALDAKLLDHGYNRPDCELSIGSDAFWVKIRGAHPGNKFTNNLLEFFSGGTPAEALKKAEGFKVPNIEDEQRKEFIESLGKLIDKGREIGIDVDFINPLETSMRALSENILEHSAGRS